MKDEDVLVVPTSLLERLGMFRGVTDDVGRYLPTLLDPAHQLFLPRRSAEDDPTHKQLIPYAMLVAGDRIFRYARSSKGGESRLHAKLSLGIGGHVSREDAEGPDTLYRNGFARELAEEVRIGGPSRERIIGLVHDDSNPVGAVHLGIVHRIDLDRPDVTPLDPALADGEFVALAEIHRERDRLESWSQFCLSLIDRSP
jgi:predicted NUDIX family phosphoesterase